MKSALSQVAASSTYVPCPPGREEMVRYFGRQHRWLPILMFLGPCGVLYGILVVALRNAFTAVLMAPALVILAYAVTGLQSGVMRRQSTLDEHRRKVGDWSPKVTPSVDVLLPSCGERIDILATTYRHVATLAWSGRLNIYVLDDADREEVCDLALRYGFTYSSRPDRGFMGKAGNLKYGYELSDGDFILILDADVAPRPDLLREVLPYLDDPRVGILQTPQYFDDHAGLTWFHRGSASAQEFFYRWVQPSADAVHGAICVGTNAVYRREALRAAGGFPQTYYGDDIHTGVRMLAAGYVLRYVPVVVAKGLCPDTFSAYCSMIYRWCLASMSVMGDRHFRRTRMGFRQRLCFWSGFLYYISTAVMAIVGPLPGLLMIWVYPEDVRPLAFVPLMPALFTTWVLIPAVVSRRLRLDVIRLAYLSGFVYLIAIWDALRNRRLPWIPTGVVAKSALDQRVQALVIGWGGIVQFSLVLGVARGVWQFGFTRFWVNAMDAILLTLVLWPLFAAALRTLRRASNRRGTRIPAQRAVAASDPAAQARRFRPDIEGLRAVAVLLVVLYHAELMGLGGGYVGVDVFFVISGFLITGHLVSAVAEHGWRALPAFYARRIRRLLPAAVLVTATTVVAAAWWAPGLEVRRIATDAVYASVYGLNYHLAAEGAQYLHADDGVSPLQHFWSLNVEEQFYLGWPLLILIVGGAALAVVRRARATVLTVVLAAIMAGSLWRSITVTASSTSWAYFALDTRAWELALGGLIALSITRLNGLPRLVAAGATLAGLTAILLAAVTLNQRTAYPGYAAILPVGGAALVVAAGCTRRPAWVQRILGEPVLQAIGRVSYSWYLWHWPMLILAPYVLGHPLSWSGRLEVAAISLAAANLTYYTLENPVRKLVHRDVHWLRFGTVLTAAVAVTAALVASSVPMRGTGRPVTLAELDPADPQMVKKVLSAVADGVTITQVPSNLRPSLSEAARDTPRSSANGCLAQLGDVNQGPCVFGHVNGQHTVVLFGDSHIEQWLPAVADAATQVNWRVVVWTKAACPAAVITVYNPALKRTYTECDQWRAKTMDRIKQLHPDLVLVGQSDETADPTVTDSTWARATVNTLEELSVTGTSVDLILDNPVSAQNVPICVSEHLDDVKACAIPRSTAYRYLGRHLATARAAAQAGFVVFDPVVLFCTDAVCPAVAGNTLVYRDANHMTATYSRWLAPMIGLLLTR